MVVGFVMWFLSMFTPVLEYVYTKYQSGPIYHDHTISINDHVSGQDNYYNHYIYSGWQHWGQVMGNPLYLSPIYNDNGCIEIMNNRFVAWHLGFDGSPIDNLDYRVLATYQTGYGTYSMPYLAPRYSFSMMIELGYRFNHSKGLLLLTEERYWATTMVGR